MQPFPPCAGIIVFNGDQTILVSTEQGNLSFPKGKRNTTETDIAAAWRELQEETGLTQNDVRLVDGVHFDELSDKGNPSVRYFVGQLIADTGRSLTFDSTELASVRWYPVSDALQMDRLKASRRNILEQAKRYRN